MTQPLTGTARSRDDEASTREAEHPPSRRIDWIVGAVTVGIYLIVQLLLLQAPMPYDPARYFNDGGDFPDIPANLWTTRSGVLIPVSIARALFGHSEAAFYAIPILTGMLLVGTVYALVVMLFHNRGLAVAAGLLVALNPYLLLNSSQIFPDTMAAATFALGFLVLFAAGRRMREQGLARATLVLFAIAGVIFGATYLIREFTVVLFPLVGLALLQLRVPWRAFFVLAGGAAVTWFIEPLYGQLVFDRPLVHFKLLFGRNEKGFREQTAARVDNYYDQIEGPLDALAVLPRLLTSFNVGWLFLVLVAAFAIALVVTRDRRLQLLGAWCFGFWAIMVVIGLGRLPSGRWILNVTNLRYWTPIFPPLVAGGVGGLYLLIRRMRLPPRALALSVAPVLGFALITSSLGSIEYARCEDANVWRAPARDRWSEFRDFLRSSDGETFTDIWTDPWTLTNGGIYKRSIFGKEVWDGTVRPIRKAQYISGIADPTDLLLVQRPYFAPSIPGASDVIEPKDWVPVFASSDRNLVALTHRSNGDNGSSVEAGQWWDFAAERAARIERSPSCAGNPYKLF